MGKAVASGVRGEAEAFSAGPPSATCPCQDPHRRLHAGVFFDGTNNNKDRDLPQGKQTNVVRLWQVWREGSSADALLKKKYVDGVGSMDSGKRTRQAGSEIAAKTKWYNPFSGPAAVVTSGGKLIGDLGHNVAGMAGGAGGKERLNRAYFWLKDRCAEVPKPAMKTVDVYGFSRGAALARTFVNLVNMALRKDDPAINVRFVGVYDTVGSFGMAGDDSDPGQNLYIDATDCRGLAHYTARHEYRQNFPLTIIPGVDREYPGAHSDVGGSYPPKDEDGKVNHLAFICFKDMQIASTRCGVGMNSWTTAIDAGVDVEALRKEADKYAGAGAVMTAPNSPYLKERAAFFDKYIHVSGVERKWYNPLTLLNPNKNDSTGARRKFTPKRFKLKGTPPNFDWE